MKFLKRFAIPVILIAVAAGGYVFRDKLLRLFWAIPMPSTVDQGLTVPDVRPADITLVADKLDTPWGIAFLPDESMLVTQRNGTLTRFAKSDSKAYQIEGVKEVGEGGLLGVAVHPNFADNHWIYLYMSTAAGDGTANRVERYHLENDVLTERTTIIQNIPGSIYHDGGGLAFGPDHMLYVTTGDAQKSNLAQDRASLAGKILRLKDDGTIPSDNPFGTAIWSYGHRNVQGITWDGFGRMWATEHGRSGVLSGLDELNMIEPGKNYGWPDIQGDEKQEGMETPVIHSGEYETWAPSGIAFTNGSLYFAGLRGESLYQATFQKDGSLKIQAHFVKEYGRLRAVVIGPDHLIYVSTSNRDGRGSPKPDDDKIYKFLPSMFMK